MRLGALRKRSDNGTETSLRRATSTVRTDSSDGCRRPTKNVTASLSRAPRALLSTRR